MREKNTIKSLRELAKHLGKRVTLVWPGNEHGILTYVLFWVGDKKIVVGEAGTEDREITQKDFDGGLEAKPMS